MNIRGGAHANGRTHIPRIEVSGCIDHAVHGVLESETRKMLVSSSCSTVEARKLKAMTVLQSQIEGQPACIILHPCPNVLESTLVLRAFFPPE